MNLYSNAQLTWRHVSMWLRLCVKWTSLLTIRVIWPMFPARGACFPVAGTVGWKITQVDWIGSGILNGSVEMKHWTIHIIYKNIGKSNDHDNIQFISLKHPCTRFLSEERTECLSAWIILPIKSQSRRRWLTMASVLLSKHDNAILSTWWCNELLYGYLQKQNTE